MLNITQAPTVRNSDAAAMSAEISPTAVEMVALRRDVMKWCPYHTRVASYSYDAKSAFDPLRTTSPCEKIGHA